MWNGFSRLISASVGAGIFVLETSRSGEPVWAASAEPARASGNPVPVAMNRYGTCGTKVAAEIAAAVAYRSAPERRRTSGRLTTAARASSSRGEAIQPSALGKARAVAMRWVRSAAPLPSSDGRADAASAATPLAFAAAIEVPEKYCQAAPGTELTMSSPGAATSTLIAPKFVVSVSRPSLWIDATARMFGRS